MPKKVPYKRGDFVQYASPERGAWLPAKVADVNSDGTLELEVTTSRGSAKCNDVPGYRMRPKNRGPESPSQPRQDAALERMATASGTQYQVGQKIQYSCDKQQKWVPATVEAIPYTHLRLGPGGVSPTRRGARLRLSGGTVIHDVPTYLMRHRSPNDIRREAAEERQRAEAAKRAEEVDRRRIAQDEAEICALELEIARRKHDAARRKRELDPSEASVYCKFVNGEIELTFTKHGPLGITFGTVAKNAEDAKAPTVVVQINPGGRVSRMRHCPIAKGMELTKVQARSCEALSFGAIMELVRTGQRPLTLTFSHRERYGWVNATDWGTAKELRETTIAQGHYM